jgi:hypothetical protein
MECRPWSCWWWLGSAVDKDNLTRELTRYGDAGWGGVHVIPIYGAKGWEEKFIENLSPRWMEMLEHTVTEAQRLGLGVDMTTGTGWRFGGPNVSEADACAQAVVKTFEVAAGGHLGEKFDRHGTQALVAFAADGKCVELTDKIATDGSVNWTAEHGSWRVYAVSQKPTSKVKRAAPGGEGRWLELGRVCQSARARLNGRDLGTIFVPPFRLSVDGLKPTGNELKIEVTNVAANRIRDLGRRGAKWKNFYDINFVNIDYKAFDASNWPLADSALLGPVLLRPAAKVRVK